MSRHPCDRYSPVLCIFVLLVGTILSTSSRGDERSPNGTDSELNTSIRLAELAQFSDSEVRTTGLRVLLAGADASSMVEVLDQSKKLKSKEVGIEFQLTILRELALFEPEEALRHAKSLPAREGKSAVATIFQVWSLKDLDEAIDTAKQLNDNWNAYAVDAILSSRSDLSSEDRLDVATRIMGASRANQVLRLMDATAPIENPESAWDNFLEEKQGKIDVLNMTERLRLGTIVAALVGDIGVDAVLDRIDEAIPNSLTKSNTIAKVLRFHAGNDAESALEYAIDLQQEIDPMVLSTMSLDLAKTNPEAALDALTSVRASGNRHRLQRDVVRSWTEIDQCLLACICTQIPMQLRRVSMPCLGICVQMHASRHWSRLLKTRSTTLS